MRNLVIYDFIYNVSNKKTETSDVNFKISELIPKTSDFISNVVYFFIYFTQCIFLLIIMFITAWKESLISFVGIMIISSIVIYINKKIRLVSYHIPIEQNKLNLGIEKISKNLLFIKIMRTEGDEYSKLVENIVNYSFKAIRASFLNIFASTFSPLLGTLLLVSIILFSQCYWDTSSLVLVSFLYFLIRFIQLLSLLATYYGSLSINFNQTKISFNYFKTFNFVNRNIAMLPSDKVKYLGSSKNYSYKIATHSKIFKDEEYSSNGISNITFNNVFYSYQKNTLNATKYVIQDLNFNICKGEQIGIIGTSGSGKTTLLMLLLGLIEPTCGRILINNEDAFKFFKLNVLNVGYVGPESYLIKGSIKDNLLYGIHRYVEYDEIIDALKRASLLDLVHDYTLDYIISEDRSGLSAGQKQRLCLARAFLNKPQLLVLDEATSNLDAITESQIMKSIFDLKNICTTIIVTHKPEILIYADKIINLSSQKE
jgi:ABC-type multidrug transport system fused ATPase/permease subunit